MPNLNEAKTRALLINPQLEKAGWNLSDRSQIQVEVPVTGYDPTPWNGFTDYCLYHSDGSILAVIEAQRSAREVETGYASALRDWQTAYAELEAAAGLALPTVAGAPPTEEKSR